MGINDYGFEYTTLIDEINMLKQRVAILEQENVETTNILYEILNSLDRLAEMDYNDDITKGELQ
jgi:hypothetical protein